MLEKKNKPKKQLALNISEKVYNYLEEVSEQMNVTKTSIVEHALNEFFERTANERISEIKETKAANESTKRTRGGKGAV